MMVNSDCSTQQKSGLYTRMAVIWIVSFYYRYFSQQAVKGKQKAADDDDSDVESISDAEFDAFLGKLQENLIFQYHKSAKAVILERKQFWQIIHS